MIPIHAKCGGIVNLQARRCSKCRKKWNILEFWLSPRSIRMQSEPSDYKVYRPKEDLKTVERLISERIPGGSFIVTLTGVFKYPRQKWARALIVVGILATIIGLVIWRFV